jgi:hypothetical protein
MWPFNDIGSSIGDQLKQWASDAFNGAMQTVWNGSMDLLRAAFSVADKFSVFSVSTTSGPIQVIWPLMVAISGAVAVGLFFWQLITVNLSGGRGFLRLLGGPAQYGAALAITVGMVASFLAAAQALTNGILAAGLHSSTFASALTHTTLGQAASTGVKAVVLGICALVGVIPAALGYLLEMLFRQAATYVLVASVPVVAAGLLANVTSSWFWRTCRWLLSAIIMEPVLALTLVVGVSMVGGSQGVTGLLAGIGILVISLFAPFVVFRLFAFVDPNTDAGAGFRNALAGMGVDSYGSNNPAFLAGKALRGEEDTNTSRFDDAIAQGTDNAQSTKDGSVGRPAPGASDAGTGGGLGEAGEADEKPATAARGDGSAANPGGPPSGENDTSPTKNNNDGNGDDSGPDGGDGNGGGGGARPPTPPPNGGGPRGGGGAEGAQGAEGAEEAAVVL